jgi:hypothetical protein
VHAVAAAAGHCLRCQRTPLLRGSYVDGKALVLTVWLRMSWHTQDISRCKRLCWFLQRLPDARKIMFRMSNVQTLTQSCQLVQGLVTVSPHTCIQSGETCLEYGVVVCNGCNTMHKRWCMRHAMMQLEVCSLNAEVPRRYTAWQSKCFALCPFLSLALVSHLISSGEGPEFLIETLSLPSAVRATPA